MPDAQADSIYDADTIFHDNGPIDPRFMADAIHALMRAMPLDTAEPESIQQRHMNAALIALAATNPRDPIEVMLAVQAIAAYQAACACWRIGMNLRSPRGDSTRHITAAATATRTFDSMLRALERRQARPLAVPAGRPGPRTWTGDNAAVTLKWLAERIRGAEEAAGEALEQAATRRFDPPPSPVVWSAETLEIARQVAQDDRFNEENAGLDLASTTGILPGGGMIVPEEPTPQQAAYIARRLGLMYKREYAESLRQGRKIYPKIRPIRAGDFIP